MLLLTIGLSAFPNPKWGSPTLPDSIVQSSFVIIRDISFSGNNITKERIIRRELLFNENDTIPINNISKIFKESRQNLVNTSLFNIVHIDSIPVENSPGQLDVKLSFVEQWYIWPVPILEFADRNVNEWLKKKDWLISMWVSFYQVLSMVN